MRKEWFDDVTIFHNNHSTMQPIHHATILACNQSTMGGNGMVAQTVGMTTAWAAVKPAEHVTRVS